MLAQKMIIGVHPTFRTCQPATQTSLREFSTRFDWNKLSPNRVSICRTSAILCGMYEMDGIVGMNTGLMPRRWKQMGVHIVWFLIRSFSLKKISTVLSFSLTKFRFFK